MHVKLNQQLEFFSTQGMPPRGDAVMHTLSLCNVPRLEVEDGEGGGSGRGDNRFYFSVTQQSSDASVAEWQMRHEMRKKSETAWTRWEMHVKPKQTNKFGAWQIIASQKIGWKGGLNLRPVSTWPLRHHKFDH